MLTTPILYKIGVDINTYLIYSVSGRITLKCEVRKMNVSQAFGQVSLGIIPFYGYTLFSYCHSM